MPSVGISSVGVVQARRAAALSWAGFGFDQSSERSWVRTVLISSTTGAFSPSANSAYSILAPYLPSSTRRSVVALPDHWFLPGAWYSALTEGTGIHTRAAPAGSRPSTRVVISK